VNGARSPRITLFLAGDVMVGRGIDQVLPHPGQPEIPEAYLHSALDYVALAEARSGPIGRPVDFAYVWGDALAELDREAPDVRIVNLETAITTRGSPWPGKAVHYRMHPANVSCLTAAKLDCCVLANNHVLDWGYWGLVETLATLRGAGIKTAGAGRHAAEAAAPAVIEVGGDRRVAVFAYGCASSGIPPAWAAGRHRPGVNLLPDLSAATAREIARQVGEVKRPATAVVASIHWGENWGHEVPAAQRTFAHRLIEEAGVDVVHGHSSHHPKVLERHGHRLVLYGCGDLLNDYEGIDGEEAAPRDLALMYLASLDAGTGQLRGLRMTPTTVRGFRICRASPEGGRALRDMLNRETARAGLRTRLSLDDVLTFEGS
jgi:poly-gamma-glutamate synthesis protein (capsule biosynthesis protein)